MGAARAAAAASSIPTACSTSCRSTRARPTTCARCCGAIVDGSELDEFKALYGTTVVCAFAHIDGHRVGIVANNGILFSESSLKAAHFIELCDRRGIPLVFVQNITGFMVGRDYEAGGIAKDGAKLVTAVSCARVPKLTVVVGGSHGAGNYGMCGRAYSPALPVHVAERADQRDGRRAGGDGAGNDPPRARRGRAATEWPADEEEAFKAELREQFEHQGNPIYSTARLWDDGVIDPRDTRDVLAKALAACAPAPLGEVGYGVFRM